MTFAALRSVPKAEWAGVLSSVSSFLLPSHVEEKPKISALQQSVLNELIGRFGIKDQEIPERLMSAVQNVLLNELSAALINSKPDVVRKRVGQQGLLAANQYQFKFLDKFKAVSEQMGISRPLALATIQTPDQVEHLHPSRLGLGGSPEHSLFVKAHPTITACSVLVLTVRQGMTLMIEGGWLIFHEVVGLEPSESPLQCLEKLAEHYGIPFSVGDFYGKFLILKEIEIVPGRDTEFLRFKAPRSEFADYRFSHSIDGVKLKISLAFILGSHEYRKDLKEHGVKIAPDTQIQTTTNFLY